MKATQQLHNLGQSLWLDNTAVAAKVPGAMQDHLGIAVGKQTFKAYRTFLASERWQRAMNFGDEGAKAFVKSWGELMGVIETKSDALKKAS